MIRPLRDYIIVRPLEQEPEGLIQIVKLGAAKFSRGEVLAVGPGKKSDDGRYVPWGTKVGDRIQFTDVVKYPVIHENGEKLLILQEADVCLIEEPEHAVA